MEKLIEMNHKMLQTISIITKENETLLHIIVNLTGNKSKPQNKTNVNPNGYCWTHSYCIGQGHTSKICTPHATGHREEATRANNFVGAKQINQKHTSNGAHQQGTRSSNLN